MLSLRQQKNIINNTTNKIWHREKKKIHFLRANHICCKGIVLHVLGRYIHTTRFATDNLYGKFEMKAKHIPQYKLGKQKLTRVICTLKHIPQYKLGRVSNITWLTNFKFVHQSNSNPGFKSDMGLQTVHFGSSLQSNPTAPSNPPPFCETWSQDSMVTN